MILSIRLTILVTPLNSTASNSLSLRKWHQLALNFLPARKLSAISDSGQTTATYARVGATIRPFAYLKATITCLSSTSRRKQGSQKSSTSQERRSNWLLRCHTARKSLWYSALHRQETLIEAPRQPAAPQEHPALASTTPSQIDPLVEPRSRTS